MNNLPIIANMKKAARDRSLTTIGGGVFAPVEIEQAARLLEAVPELVAALEYAMEAIAYYNEHEGAPGMVEAARAALAKVTPT